MDHPNIRAAVPSDAETIFGFICDLAEFENARHEVETDIAAITETVFGENSVCDALIYEDEGKPLAFALWYYTYSTWQGRAGLYLEDLYVSPDARGRGIGSTILKYLANYALEKGYGRFEWSVLDWNTPAIKTYDATGAKPQSEWIRYRLSGTDLQDFAKA
ncbi:GNAT family N-acetyltransferase [Rhizobium sp. L1K21]|uniref:GNAT family N-acetyltransferase n=1 Tax=Rhizobium sp. L1K21 TaxID=2954933 RepID=UPI0020937219|nr:GNAT family N-acetyltransferase [Rhizobium sp. L1K21]MCO6186972.1 GNAT family N-acetyltransferase [Rhizobium sp. L1K21]